MKRATKADVRRVVDLLGRADLLEAAAAHHRDAVGHGERLFLVVRHEHEGDADVALDALQLELHLAAQLEVERRERLVEQQRARVVHERARERDALALAAGELARLALGEVAEPHDVEHLAHAPLELGRARIARMRGPKATLSNTERCGKSA